MAGPKLSEESILAFRDNLILEEKKHIHHGKVSPGCLCFFSLCWGKTCNKGIGDGL